MAMPKDEDYCQYTKDLDFICKDNVLVCGDILDSTFIGPIPEELLNKFSFNLRNIKLLLFKRDTFKLIIGNRDINKIKVFPLAELTKNFPETPGTSLTSEFEQKLQCLINDFNNGKIDVTAENYSLLKKYAKFTVSNMNNFYPFWKMDNDGEYKGKDWNYTKQDTFHQRYLNIFGADINKPDDNTGTMSAQNTINTFYHELKILHSGFVEEENNIEPNDLNDYKAFVVLSIYRSLLFPVSSYCPKN